MSKVWMPLALSVFVLGACRDGEDETDTDLDTDDTDVAVEPNAADLATAKTALDPYTNAGTAVGAGFISTAAYVRHPELGSMGIHFINVTQSPLLENLDLETPMVLLYNLTEDGMYELGGAEWYVEDPNVTEAPTLFDVPLDGPMEGHEPTQGLHYDIHAWLWIESTTAERGVISEFNADMEPPSWIQDYDNAVFARLSPTGFDGYGDADGGAEVTACVPGLGTRLENDAITGDEAVGEAAPNAIYTWDFDGEGPGPASVIAIEWTEPSDSTRTLFGGKAFTTEGDGKVFRLWFAAQPAGIFNATATNPAITCPT